LLVKSNNLKASITNTGDKIKENTVDKLKRKMIRMKSLALVRKKLPQEIKYQK